MKKSLLLLCFALSILVPASAISQATKESLVGKWQLTTKSGGMTGQTVSFGTDSKKIIEFTLDCRYKIYEGDSLKHTKNYHLIKSESIYDKRDSVYLLEIENSFIMQSFSIHEDILVLSDECYDCYSRSYRRVPPRKSIKQGIERQ